MDLHLALLGPFGLFWAIERKKNQATNLIVYLLYFGFFFGVRPDLVDEGHASGAFASGAFGPFLMIILAFLGPFWTTKSSNLSSLPRPRLRNLKEKEKYVHYIHQTHDLKGGKIPNGNFFKACNALYFCFFPRSSMVWSGPVKKFRPATTFSSWNPVFYKSSILTKL